MSEANLNEIDEPGENTGAEEPGTDTPGTADPPTPPSKSIINQAIEAVMDLIDGLKLFASITRGALGTKSGLCCEIGPSAPFEVYLDKNQYIPIDLTINGKHDNLETLSEAMNRIHEELTMLTQYPSGTDWHITDIVTATEPQVIGRQDNNGWMMASSLSVRIITEKE